MMRRGQRGFAFCDALDRRPEFPALRTFADREWRIVTPAAVVQLSNPIPITADGSLALLTVVVPPIIPDRPRYKSLHLRPTDPSFSFTFLGLPRDSLTQSTPPRVVGGVPSPTGTGKGGRRKRVGGGTGLLWAPAESSCTCP